MTEPPVHSAAFRRRRFLNWFPLGLTYAFLYMGRYNLTVAKNALGDLLTKEDFGTVFGVGTAVYAVSFLINGPLTDRVGGKKAILASAIGAGLANLALGFAVRDVLSGLGRIPFGLVTTLSALYAVNMYFQSAAAVAIVKVNSSWFHVRERGGFSGIFGTMIASGVFFAFSVNEWILAWSRFWSADGRVLPWWVFFAPAGLLIGMAALEAVLLRDRPGQAGFEDFDTGDASSGIGDDVPLRRILRGVVTNPIILTVALVEFCTGVLRNGVMHWFPIHAREVLSLPPGHVLRNGSWSHWPWLLGALAVGASLMGWASRLRGRRRSVWFSLGGLVALAPFLWTGWGGWLFVAGVLGANVAGFVSDHVFQSRRAPVAALLYVLAALAVVAMWPALVRRPPIVGWVDETKVPLRPGDEVLNLNDGAARREQRSTLRWWNSLMGAIRCVPSQCRGEGVRWDLERCLCTRSPKRPAPAPIPTSGKLVFQVRRDGEVLTVEMEDPLFQARAGDQRILPMGPPEDGRMWLLVISVFLISVAVIGTHGLLSGTATMDFGGRRGAATAVGLIDGFVYLGTALQSFALGHLTTSNWSNWPTFLLPFALLGLYLLTRIWHAIPRGGSH